MGETKKDLADFVRSLMNKQGLSTYDVAKAAGNDITAATVTKVINREIRSNSIQTLSALAKGLGVPPEQLFRVSRGLPPESDPRNRYEIYAERFDAHELTDAEWQFIETVLKAQIDLLRQQKPDAREVIDAAKVIATIESEKSSTRHEIAENLKKAGDAIKKRKAG